MCRLCLSSELYPIDPKDIDILEDGAEKYLGYSKKEVIVLIGDSEKGEKDTLISGRNKVRQALKNGDKNIPTRFAFISKIKRYDFITVFIKKLRNKNKIFSSNIYHIDPHDIRRLKIERNIRNKDNAYVFSNPRFYCDLETRKKLYNELYSSMQKGYDDRWPLDIMLLRMMGIKDTINQGHHRMGIAIDCNLDRVAIRFSAVGQAPFILRPILKIIADINISLKLWNKNK